MAGQPIGSVLHRLRRLIGGGEQADSSDRQLLGRFVASHDESAFRTLVERHGPMVRGVCRRLLDNSHDADDAFQATFLVLVRKADAIAWHDSVGSWLYQVACRIALKARSCTLRRKEVEQSVEERTSAPGLAEEERSILDEELGRLPAKYRAPLVLCYLQGKTHEEAAGELGWPRGSIAKRLGRAQDLLRDRLTGRGLVLTAAAVASVLSESAATAASPALIESTVRAATLFAAGEAAASAQAVVMAEGVILAMFFKKLKIAALVLLLAGIVGSGIFLWQPTQAADSPTRKPADPAQTKADKPALVKGNTEFAVDLYGKLRDKQGNLFLSPYSVSTALGMTYAGARNQTADQMGKVLHFAMPQDRVSPAFAALISETKPTKGYQLSVANALWCQTGFNLQKDYLGIVEGDYAAALQGLDFAKATEEARQTINAWVEKKTQDKIKELLKPGTIQSDTKLVLTNAIYFKGDWATKFKKEATRDEPFVSGGQKLTVPMMHQKEKFGYLDGGTFQALEMPYVGKELSMVVLLPKKADGLADLEKSLTAEKLQEWTGKLRQQSVIVSLPRFKMTTEFLLNDQLQALGMSDAFTDRADFSGITGKRDLAIAAVIHKAFVEVNEEGTEAAAATAIVLAPTSAIANDPVFKADHPFLFVIRDLRNGSVLFMGRLVTPEKN